MDKSSLLRRPSAFLPVAMSGAAFLTVLVHIAFFGTAREPDEGTAAHIWQLLMVSQLPIIAWFALKWMPRTPRDAWPILGLQLAAALVALAPVFLLGL